MIKYNTILILNQMKDQILFCKRMKDPYLGLYNLVGGKIEAGETSEAAAYRELLEETGISREDVHLYHFMDFNWYLQDMLMEVYAGVLEQEVELVPEKNPLQWMPIESDFFDMSMFAGEGNIGHMVEILKSTKEIFGPIPISLVQLQEQGCLYVENIKSGFVQYEHRLLSGSPAEIREFLCEQIQVNGWENAYVDFYYGRLSSVEKAAVHQVLTDQQVRYLTDRYFGAEEVYFQMTEELFAIAFQLSITEVLFSSFYFSKIPCTVWGNYEQKFVVFEPHRFR